MGIVCAEKDEACYNTCQRDVITFERRFSNMRQIYNLNTKWAFSKEAESVPATMPEKWYWVTLPHMWRR